MTTLTAATPTMTGSLASSQVSNLGAAPLGGLSGADVLRIIRQRLILICVLWIILSGIGTAFSIFMRIYYPKYSAFSLIRVESISPPNVMDPLKRELLRAQEIERELQNQVLLVTSPTVLQKALGDPGLRRTEWFQEAEQEAKDKNDSVVDLLADILSANPIRDSNYIKVTAVWKVRSELPTIVNTVVQKYVSEIDRQRKNAIRLAEEQLSGELDRSRKFFEAKKREIENFRNTSEFSTFTSREANDTLLTLKSLVTELEVEMLGRKTQWETLQNTTPEQLPITAELQAILRQDPTIAQLEQRRLFAEQDLDLALQQFGPKHRVAERARLAFEASSDRVDQERAVKTLTFQKRQIEQAQRNYLETQDQLLALKERLYEAKAEQRDKDVKQTQYEGMLDERDLLRLQYENLLEKKNNLSMTLRQKRTVQIDVQSSAIEPMRISSPNLKIWIPAGCILGLMMSIGFAFLLELADKSVRTPRDVMRSQLPVLGSIPSTDDDEVEIERVETACLDAPHSIVAEAFRHLRANLFFSAPAEQQGVLLITSASGGNGKTTVASNLAISIALSGRRVLLIDANFRRAKLPRIFPDMKTEGLSNILIGQGSLHDYVTPTSVPGLDALSAGPIPPNPAELLGSSYLRDIVVDARTQYDQVIIDGPPVLLVSDAMVLAGAVDGCLLICQYRKTSRGELQRTHSSLQAINARVFGAVLNQVQTRAGGYFRKTYREFYKYHEPDDDGQGGLPAPQLDVTSVAATEQSRDDLPSTDQQPESPDRLDTAQVDELASPEWLEKADTIAIGGIEPMATEDDLPDLGDVEDLDIIDVHDLNDKEEVIESVDLDTGELPDIEIPELESDGSAFDAAELDDGGVLDDDLSELVGDDFNLEMDTSLESDDQAADDPENKGTQPSP